MTKITLTSCAAAACLALGLAAAGPAQAGTLENLERERAIFIDSLLDPEPSPNERIEKVRISKRRLVDLERMVLRDKSLTGRNTPTVRRAFENYDLTFLVHASTEKNVSAIDAWLAEVGITTQSLMSAEMGRR
jgi:hypothetical protein